MEELDHLLITRIVKNISCVKERARLSCVSRDWRYCVESSWTDVELECYRRERNEVLWLANQLDGSPGLLHHLSLRFRGGNGLLRRTHETLQQLQAPAFMGLISLRLSSQDQFSDDVLQALAIWLPNLRTLNVRGAYNPPAVATIGNALVFDVMDGHLVEKFNGYSGFTQLKELTIHALRPRETRKRGGCLASALTGLSNLEKLVLRGENAVLDCDEGGVLRSLLNHLAAVEVSVGHRFWEFWGGPVESQTLQSADFRDTRGSLPFSQTEPLPPLHCPCLHTLSTNLRLPSTGLPVYSLRNVTLSMMRISDISSLQPLYGCTHLSMTLSGLTPSEHLQCQYFKLDNIPLPSLEELHVHFDDLVHELELSPDLSSLTRLQSLQLGGVVMTARGVEIVVIGGHTTQMTALRELRIHSLRVNHSVMQSPHLRHLSLVGSGEFSMDAWPNLANLSGLTRLDLLHVPAPPFSSSPLVLPHVTTLNIQFGYEPYKVFEILKGRAGRITPYDPSQWAAACQAVLEAASEMPTLRGLKLVAGKEPIVIDLSKLRQLNHLSVACHAVTLKTTDCHARIPPSLDIMSVCPFVLDGISDMGLSPQTVTRPAAPRIVWRLKIGFVHDLDLGCDTLDDFLAELAPTRFRPLIFPTNLMAY